MPRWQAARRRAAGAGKRPVRQAGWRLEPGRSWRPARRPTDGPAGPAASARRSPRQTPPAAGAGCRPVEPSAEGESQASGACPREAMVDCRSSGTDKSRRQHDPLPALSRHPEGCPPSPRRCSRVRPASSRQPARPAWRAPSRPSTPARRRSSTPGWRDRRRPGQRARRPDGAGRPVWRVNLILHATNPRWCRSRGHLTGIGCPS